MYQAALAAIEKEYVEPVDGAQLVYGSIDGLLRTLDPALELLGPRRVRADARADRRPLLRRRHHHRVGRRRSSRSRSLFEESPAYRAGIRRNDVIARVGQPVAENGKTHIAWEDTKGWATEEIVKRVRGPEGHDGGTVHPPPGRRHAHRPDGRARRNQDHDGPHGVHDRAGHRLHPPAGLLGNDRRRNGRGAGAAEDGGHAAADARSS